MARLNDLPLELFSQIADDVLLGDIISLAYTCRRLHEYLYDRLADVNQRLKRGFWKSLFTQVL